MAQLTPPSPLVGRAAAGQPRQVPRASRPSRDRAHVARIGERRGPRRHARGAHPRPPRQPAELAARALRGDPGAATGDGERLEPAGADRPARSGARRLDAVRRPPRDRPRAAPSLRLRDHHVAPAVGPSRRPGAAAHGRAVDRRPPRRLDVRPAARRVADAGPGGRRRRAGACGARARGPARRGHPADRGRPRRAPRAFRGGRDQRLRSRRVRRRPCGRRRAVDPRAPLARAHRPGGRLGPVAAGARRWPGRAAPPLARRRRPPRRRLRGACDRGGAVAAGRPAAGGHGAHCRHARAPARARTAARRRQPARVRRGCVVAQRGDHEAVRVPGRGQAGTRARRGHRGGAHRGRGRRRHLRGERRPRSGRGGAPAARRRRGVPRRGGRPGSLRLAGVGRALRAEIDAACAQGSGDPSVRAAAA